MTESAKKPFVILTYVVLTLSTLLVFWPVRNFDFVNYDDNDYVFENQHVSSGLSRDGVIWAFTTGRAANWHPLTWLSLMLDCQLFGANPGEMHLVNVLLHLANTLLLFTVLMKMTGSLWPSAFVAAVFALHPMHVESVAWIAERKDVLSTLFLLLTLFAYAGYVKRPSVFRYLMALVLFAFGLMAKPMLVTLPFLLLLMDYWPLNRFNVQSRYRIIAEKIPFIVLAAASSLVTILVQRAGGAVADITILPLRARVANAFVSYARYVGKMFWPENLAVFYPFDAGSIVFWRVAMCVLLLLVISIFVIRFGRYHKFLPVGWFWFVAALVPVIGLVQVGGQAFADRYTYIPYIGLAIMVAWGLPELLSRWPQRKIALGLSMAIVLTTLGICTHRQVSYWNNGTTLFSHAIAVTQNNGIACNNLGVAYESLGRHQDAIAAYKQAANITPNYAEAHYNLGIAYNSLGRYQEAIEAFSQAIGIKPDYAEAHKDRGVAYGKLGRWQEAMDAYKQAINSKPDFAEARYGIGNVYSRLGRWQEATEAFSQAVRIRPDFVEAYNNLGFACGKLGRGAEAIDAYHQAIKIRPDSAATYNNLALLLATSRQIRDRDPNEAIRFATRACQLTSYKDPAYLGTLAAAYASAGRFTDAVDTANKALGLADATNQPQLKSIIQQHLSLYRQGKPYIEPSPNPQPNPNKP